MDADRSFEFIQFPPDPPVRESLIGHDRLYLDRYHGCLTLELTALTPVSISAGITALGSDVGVSMPLVRVMGQDANGNPILQGTSLKGCVRAVYEAITNSSVGVEGAKVPGSHRPNKVEGRGADERRASKLSPAELVFGALGVQGLISIADAVGDRPLEVGYLPAMFEPKLGNGRKFYRHYNSGESTSSLPSSQSAEPAKPPSSIQQAPKDTRFLTTLRFSNLALAQLGALLIALGLDSDYSFALKLGAGKGKGLGSVKVRLVSHSIAEGEALRQARYLDYQPTGSRLPQKMIAQAIQAAHANLIYPQQLRQLRDILQLPGANL